MIQIQICNLPDFIDPVNHRIPMKIKPLCRFLDTSVFQQISVQGLCQIST